MKPPTNAKAYLKAGRLSQRKKYAILSTSQIPRSFIYLIAAAFSLCGIGKAHSQSDLPTMWDAGDVPIGTTKTSDTGYLYGGTWGEDIVVQTQTITGQDASDFSISPDYVGTTMPLGQNFPFNISFSPSREGSEIAILSFFETPPPMGWWVHYIKGNGVKPGISFHRLDGDGIVNYSATDGIDDPLEVSDDEEILSAQSGPESRVQGLVADGVTPLLMQFGFPNVPATPGTYQIGMSINGVPVSSVLDSKLRVLGDSGWTSDHTVVISGMNGFAYLSGLNGEDMPFSGSTELSVQVTLTASGVPTPVATGTFRIRRPPVVLVHGYNADSNTWSAAFRGALLQNVPADFIQPVSYGMQTVCTEGGCAPVDKTPNTRWALTELTPLLEAQMNQAFSVCQRSWACTRYDVVAHSQGGVLVRMLCQTNALGPVFGPAFASRPPVSTNDYYRGRFRRVITIGSPHNGSTLLRWWLDNKEMGSFLLNFPGIANLIQPKFDPFGSQIKAVNSPDCPVDSRIRFNCIQCTINPGQQPPGQGACPEIFHLTDVCTPLISPVVACGATIPAGTDAGQILTTKGSDGIVDFASQGGGGGTIDTYYSFFPVSHADAGSGLSFFLTQMAFGVPYLQTETGFAPIAGVVNQLLGAPASSFGPFVLPALLDDNFACKIDALAANVAMQSLDTIEEIAGGPDVLAGGAFGPKGKGPVPKDSTNSCFNYFIQPPAGDGVGENVTWFAQVYGTNGIDLYWPGYTTNGVTIQLSGTNGTQATVCVDPGIVGTVVLRAIYPSANGKLIVANPVVVLTNPPGNLIGTLLSPNSLSANIGDQIPFQIWGRYDSSNNAQLFIPDNRSVVWSSSAPAVFHVDTNSSGQAFSNGTAVVSAVYLNETGLVSVVVNPPGYLVTVDQPQSQVRSPGQSARFSVSASGAGPMSYQWYFNGAQVAGATNSSLVFTNLLLTNTGTYFAVVTNSVSAATSAVATLSVLLPPTITVQPTNQSAVLDTSATFMVAAAGSGPLSYQWQQNGAALANATNSSLTISNVQSGAAGIYTVSVGNEVGSLVSSNAVLTILSPNDSFANRLVIAGMTNFAFGNNLGATREVGEPSYGGGKSVWWTWTAPANGYVTMDTIGSSFDTMLAVYSGSVVSSLSLVAGDDDSGGNLTSRLTFYANAGTTYQIAVDGYGGVTGNIILRIRQAPSGPPAIIGQPQPGTTIWGGQFTFNVSAVGSLPLSYQWLFQGTNYPGAVAPALTITNVQFANVGGYQIIVSNSYGSVTSALATLTVDALPHILSQPTNQSAVPGGGAAFATTVTGAPPLFYQWQFNGTSLPGATTPTLSLSNVQNTNAGNYLVVVSNAYGMVTSAPPAVLTMLTLSSGLVSWWKGDGDATDSVGRNNGALVGAVSFSNGVSGQAFFLNGGYVTVPDSPSLDFTAGSFATFSVWAYRTGAGLPFHIYGKRVGCSGDATTLSYQLGIDGSFPPTPINEWLLWTLIYNGGQVSVYTNGVMVSGVSWPDFAFTNSAPFEIGMSGACGGFFGLIDDVRVYKRALFPTEVWSLYTSEAPPPIILAPPADQHAVVGGAARFTVAASSAAAVSYQWRLNATNLADNARVTGSQGSTLSIVNLQLPDAGSYQVIITNAYGSTTSDSATLTVDPGLVLYQTGFELPGFPLGSLVGRDGWVAGSGSSSNAAQIVSSGSGQLLQISGPASVQFIKPLSYDPLAALNPRVSVSADFRFNLGPTAGSTWLFAFLILSDQNGAAFESTGINAIGQLFGQNFGNPNQVVAASAYGANAPHNLRADLDFGTREVSYFMDGVSFGVTPFNPGSSNLVGGVNLILQGGEPIDSTLLVDNLSVTGAGAIPSITTQPQSRTVGPGAGLALVVGAAGTPPLSYQWRFNGNEIANATNSSLSLINVQYTAAGSYQVVITNVYGSITSAIATLTVTAPPSITSQPQNLSVQLGLNATFLASAAGPGPLRYQWRFNGTNLPGASGTFLNINSSQFSNAGNYKVVVTNSYGAVTSATVFLSIIGPLTNSLGAIAAPPGMVNWWPADGNANDIYGTNNGAPQGGMSYVPGKAGLAFRFDGSSAYVNVGASNIPPPWTASLWVNRQNAASTSAALMGSSTYGLKLEQQNGTRKVGITQFGVADYAFNYTAPVGTWVHLVFVGTSSNTTLYANGVSQGSLSVVVAMPRYSIGAHYNGLLDRMLGSLDEIIVFNRALSGAEINAIYLAGSVGMVKAPQFLGITALGNGQLGLNLEGLTGKGFTVYGSTNLVSWVPLATLPNPNGTTQFIDYSATNINQRFYRASQPQY